MNSLDSPVTLPDGWNHPSSHSSGTKCSVCSWDGNPLKLFLDGGLNQLIPLKDLSKRGLSKTNECIRCHIMTLAVHKLSHVRNKKPPSENFVIHFEGNNEFYADRHSIWSTKFSLFVSPKANEPKANEPKAKVPCGIPQCRREKIDTSTKASVCWAKHQIEAHLNCCQPKDTDPFVPTRLIRVDRSDLGNDVVLERKESYTPHLPRYVSLSYRWGKDPKSYRTTKQTLAKDGPIDWDILPKTIQDSITFTRSLKISYLWVDRLCIVQDDKEDWERESGQMFDVYRSSHVTLAAVWGEHSDSGLFKAERWAPIRIGNLRLLNGNWDILVRQHHEPASIWDGYKGQIVPTPHLFSRAWTYQERLISPRVLYFTDKELEFECFCSTACECGLTQFRQNLVNGFADKRPKKVFFDNVMNVAEGEADLNERQNNTAPRRQGHIETSTKACRTWMSMIDEYSKLELTEPTDKLPAIGAVAKQFKAARCGEDYLAGLWSGTLLRDLLWAVIHSWEMGTHKLATAPTWSWASIPPNNNKIYYMVPDSALTPTAKVLSTTCNYVDNNQFGVLKKSSLKLRSRLIPCWLRQKAENVITLYHPHPRLEIHGFVCMDISLHLSSTELEQKVYLFEIAEVSCENSTDRYFLILGQKRSVCRRFVRYGVFRFNPGGMQEHRIYEEAMDTILKTCKKKTISLI